MSISVNSIVDNWWNDPVHGENHGIVPRILLGAAAGCAAYAAFKIGGAVQEVGLLPASAAYVATAVVAATVSATFITTAVTDIALLLAKTANEYAAGTLKMSTNLLSKATEGITKHTNNLANDLFGDPSIKLAPLLVQQPESVVPTIDSYDSMSRP